MFPFKNIGCEERNYKIKKTTYRPYEREVYRGKPSTSDSIKNMYMPIHGPSVGEVSHMLMGDFRYSNIARWSRDIITILIEGISSRWHR